MKFETLLARRYIKAQKRHSILTVCSIVISVALMTLMFTCFTTLRGIFRDIHYETAPYHVVFFNVTKEQGAAIRHINQVASCELIQNPNGVTYQAQVLFGDYIDDQWQYCNKMIHELKLNAICDRDANPPLAGMDFNDSLLLDDGITLAAKYAQTQILALFFVYIIAFALILRLIIDTAFEVSSKERERQFGVLQSIGATTKQIVRIMTAEGMMLSVVGIPLGVGCGLILSIAVYKAVLASGIAEAYLEADQIARVIHIHISPLMTLVSGFVGLAWVFFSAYGTGMRVIKKSPIQAITARSNTVKKVKRFTLLSLLFGWKGKIASRNARRNPKRFAMTVLSLMLSLTMFATVSAIFKTAEETLVDAIIIEYDEFGDVDYDFDLLMGVNAGLHDPLDYRESVEMLEESGYFEPLQYNIYKISRLPDKERGIQLYYFSRGEYERVFGKKPKISYDELTRSGGAILLNDTTNLFPENTDSVTINVRYLSEITEAEYNEATAEKQKRNSADATTQKIKRENAQYLNSDQIQYYEGFDYDENGNKISVSCWYKSEMKPTAFHVVQRMEIEPDLRFVDVDRETWPVYLILTEDTFRNTDWVKYGKVTLSGNNVRLKLRNESDYAAAKNFLFENGDLFNFHAGDPDIEWRDMFGVSQRIRKTILAVHIGIMFVLIMIVLVAIVNMVNIVSTGILNRKQELASMQCVGMTHGQLYAMTVIECLQFTLWAAISATILCIVLMNGTEAFMTWVGLGTDQVKRMMKIGEPLLKVWLGSIAAFLCAMTASVFPMKRMQKEPLVEQIRAVE